jgi:hypothetical protein
MGIQQHESLYHSWMKGITHQSLQLLVLCKFLMGRIASQKYVLESVSWQITCQAQQAQQ